MISIYDLEQSLNDITMKVCLHCFNDYELKAFAGALLGNDTCTVCGSKEVALTDLDEFKDFFEELLSHIEPATDGVSLLKLVQDLGVFRDDTVAKAILSEVLQVCKTPITHVSTPVKFSDEIEESYKYWEKLKEDVKWNYRFLGDIQRLLELGADSFFDIVFELKPEMELFRARIHPESGQDPFKIAEMGCPPKHETRAGRANPAGIPCLYLSDNPVTILYEVRASYLDELSIGTFCLKPNALPVKIVDFVKKGSLFTPGLMKRTLMSRLLIDRISKDLSKPMRRYDSEIEYIPTQFICEFIRVVMGSKGIRFQSSLHQSGNNLVIFEQDLMECVKVQKMKITSLKLEAESII